MHMSPSPSLLWRLFGGLALGLTTALLAADPAAAQTPAVGFTSNVTGLEDNAFDTSFSLGFEFTANSPVTVTSLGYFYDPFSKRSILTDYSHEVGLYQIVPASGGNPEKDTLLTHLTVTGTSTQAGDFLYTDLPGEGLTLTAGGDYVLAGVTGSADPYFFSVQDPNQPGNIGLTIDPSIKYIQDRYVDSSGLAFPDSNDPSSEPGFFGPNFRFASPVSTVPEPSALAPFLLGGLGLAGLGLAARRRTRVL